MSRPEEHSPHRGLLRLAAVSFALSAGLTTWLARRTGLELFRALASLELWGAAVLALQALPPLPFRLRPTLTAAGAGTVAAWLWWPRTGFSTGATDANLTLAAGLCGALAFGWYFLAAYSGRALRGEPAPAPGPALLPPLARLSTAAFAGVAGTLLIWLQFQRPWFAPAAHVLLAVLALLVFETLLRALGRLYQPERSRVRAPVFGESALLPALFGEAGPFHSLLGTLERNLGLKFAEAWLVRYLRALAAPLALLGLLGLWLGTGVTRIPVDSSGVLLVRGEVQAAALPPGLHCHRPWPWARLVAVPTGRVQEIALGFERDLAGPVLWAEKHFEGEQNLLVGAGEELLTFNVPVQFRIRDAVASLRRTADPAAALAALGSRQLLTLAIGHRAFGLMTTDRADLAAQLHASLQQESDRLGLGLEIVFVGLKDVHPPVPVAPAYQDVVSAEEERATLVDEARSQAVSTLGTARIAANLTRVQADAAATARLARTAGETARFLAPLATWREHPAEFGLRLRLESLEAALAGVPRLEIIPAGTAARRSFFLGATTLPLPATTP